MGRAHEIAAAVAPLIQSPGPPGPWQPNRKRDVADHWAEIVRADGAALGFHMETSPKPRLRVSGVFPRSERTNESFGPYRNHPSIGLSPDRPAKAIATEIERRLLPEYLPLYLKAVEDKRAAEDANIQAEALAKRLAGILGTSVRENGDSLYVHAGDATFQVGRYGSIDIKVSTRAVQLAEAIAEAVKG